MKKLLIVLLACVISLSLMAQMKKPVKWSFSAIKKSASLYELHITATIDSGWKIYAQHTPVGGPMPTGIAFNKNTNVLLSGNTKEVGKLLRVHEEAFGVDVLYYKGKVDFVQLLKTRHAGTNAIAGKVVFMSCNDHECLPPDEVEFKVALK